MQVKKETVQKVRLPITCKYMKNESFRCGGQMKL